MTMPGRDKHTGWRASAVTILDDIQSRISPIFAPCSSPDCLARQQNWSQFRRRGRRVKLEQAWYCTNGCLERAAVALLVTSKTSSIDHHGTGCRMPLGLLMVSRGELSFEQLRQALNAQCRAAHGRIGEWLQELGFTTERQVTAALSVQWACPTLRITPDAQKFCAGLLPQTLQEAYCMLPVYFAPQSRILYVGFADRVAHRLLYAIERMLSCRTIPCLVTRSAFKDAIQRMPATARSTETAFGSIRDAAEMARIIASYVNRCGAGELRLQSCGEYMWARLLSRHNDFNLLFRTA
jgi:hypothetical protein